MKRKSQVNASEILIKHPLKNDSSPCDIIFTELLLCSMPLALNYPTLVH